MPRCLHCSHGIPKIVVYAGDNGYTVMTNKRGFDMPEPEGKKRVRLDVNEGAHADLRVLAAKSGLSMSAYCEAVVMEAVRAARVVKAGEPKKGRKK